MLKILFKSVIRKIKRSFFLSLIYFSVLIIGLASFYSISKYVNHELSYDKFHKSYQNIFRITTQLNNGNQESKWAITNGILVSLLKDNVPEIEDATKALIAQEDYTFRIEGESHLIKERTGFLVDPNFLKILHFDTIEKSNGSLLANPNSILLNRNLAIRLFNSVDVVGKTIIWEGADEDKTLTVTGILENLPQNSHIQFDFLISGSTSPSWESLSDIRQGGFQVFVYFLTRPSFDRKDLETNIGKALEDLFNPNMWSFPILNISEIYFQADSQFDHAKKGKLNFVNSLSFVGWLILSLSLINFLVFYSAESLKRGKEMAIRKTLGSSSLETFTKNLIECSIYVLVSGFFALIFSQIIFNFLFTEWFKVDLLAFEINDELLKLIGVLLATILISSFIPFLFVFRLKVMGLLKGNLGKSKGYVIGNRFFFTILNITVAAVIATSSFVVYKQLSFLQNLEVGFQDELILNIPRSHKVKKSEWTAFKNSIRNESYVEIAGTSLYKFAGAYNSKDFKFQKDLESEISELRLNWNIIDYETIPTMGLEIIEGRNFDVSFSSDTVAVIINETARKELGLKEAVGQIVSGWYYPPIISKVIGVVNDYHFQGFNRQIEPVLFMLLKQDSYDQNYLIKLNTNDFKQSIEELERQWNYSGIDSPFEYEFVENWVENFTQNDRNISNMTNFFTLICLILMIVGLFGVVATVVQRRKKEMAIRKVFGATRFDILLKLNAYFSLSTAISFAIAVPISYNIMSEWLETFAYRIPISLTHYAVSLMAIIFIVTSTITLRSIQIAGQNPQENLREE